MSFAIEVPGEAAPLGLLELGRALEAAATSLDNAQRQSAGQQLQTWEIQPNYYTLLQVSPSCICNPNQMAAKSSVALSRASSLTSP